MLQQQPPQQPTMISMGRTALNMGQPSMSRDNYDNTNEAGAEGDLPERHLRDHVRFLQFLGEGSYGAAFLCRIAPWYASSGGEWREAVIKLPPSRLRPRDLSRLTSEALRAYDVSERRSSSSVASAALASASAAAAHGAPARRLLLVSSEPSTHHRHTSVVVAAPMMKLMWGTNEGADRTVRTRREALREALVDFCKEVGNAEQLLEPPCLRVFRYDAWKRGGGADAAGEEEEEEPRAKIMWRLVGTPVHGLTEEQRLRISADQHRMRAHPGFHHMHRVQHLDRALPAIISEKADGDLFSLRGLALRTECQWLSYSNSSIDQGKPPALWVRICAQLASAFAYIQTHTTMAHVDLKPENVLYQWASSSRAPTREEPVELRCMLSDYGICHGQNKPACSGRTFPGTRHFNPPIATDLARWREANGTMLQLSGFQCAMTALDLLCVDGHSPSAYCNSSNGGIANVFRAPPQHPFIRGLAAHPTTSEALSALLRIATAGTPKPLMKDLALFSYHIRAEARVLNAGLPYYTTVVAERCKSEQARADAAEARLESLHPRPL
jgi:hypothetical protein